MGLLNHHTTQTPVRPTAGVPTREAGDKLALEAIDRSGLVITSEGALVRIIEVTPPNPLILSTDERIRVAQAFSQMVCRLRPHQSVQFYVESRPINLDELLATCRREVQAWAGPAPTRDIPAASPLVVALAVVWGDGAVAAPARR
jgi:hypothetical protein